MKMGRDVIHISAAEAARDFSSVLERVQAGAEIVIERDERPIAVVSLPPQRPGRLLSEAIAMAEARGSSVTLDEDFAEDLEKVINSHREPLNPPLWD